MVFRQQRSHAPTECFASLVQSGQASGGVQPPDLGAAEDMPPRDFVCGLDENGHAVIGIEERPAQDGADTTYLMRIDQADDLYAHVVLRNLEALTAEPHRFHGLPTARFWRSTLVWTNSMILWR